MLAHTHAILMMSFNNGMRVCVKSQRIVRGYVTERAPDEHIEYATKIYVNYDIPLWWGAHLMRFQWGAIRMLMQTNRALNVAGLNV